MAVRRYALLLLSLFVTSACDETQTTHYKECYVDDTGGVVYQRCCETKCKYDDDCYYYTGDCDVDCTTTCYNSGATPVATVVYVTPGVPPPTPTPTPPPE
jgi:hypothetical protein